MGAAHLIFWLSSELSVFFPRSEHIVFRRSALDEKTLSRGSRMHLTLLVGLSSKWPTHSPRLPTESGDSPCLALKVNSLAGAQI